MKKNIFLSFGLSASILVSSCFSVPFVSAETTNNEQIEKLLESFIEQNYKGDARVYEENDFVHVEFRKIRANEPYFDTTAISEDFDQFFKENNIDSSLVVIGFLEGTSIISNAESTPGIEVWEYSSGINSVLDLSYDEILNTYDNEDYIYDASYTNNNILTQRAFIVTKEGKCKLLIDQSNSPYSVVKMREGTEPPVKLINEKIGYENEYAVKFYKSIDGNDEYRFFVTGKDYKYEVYDILKNDSNVIAIEERTDVIDSAFGIKRLYINSLQSIEEIITQYPELGLKVDETPYPAAQNWKYVFSVNWNEGKALYTGLKRLQNSEMDYYLVIGSPEIYPDNAYSTKSKTLYSKSIISGNGDLNFDSKCDVTDLTDLSLALIGDKELNADQQKAADVDGDGAVTLADLARLQQYLSKKINAL